MLADVIFVSIKTIGGADFFAQFSTLAYSEGSTLR